MNNCADIAAANAALNVPGSPYEMEEISILDIPTHTYKNAPKTLREVLNATTEFAKRDYIVYGDERLTYGEHLQRATTLASHMVADMGIRPGDRVAVTAMRNYPEWVLSFWATTCTGAIVVPLNTWLRSAELKYCLADSGARLLIADKRALSRSATPSGTSPRDAPGLW